MGWTKRIFMGDIGKMFTGFTMVFYHQIRRDFCKFLGMVVVCGGESILNQWIDVKGRLDRLKHVESFPDPEFL